VQLVLKAKLDQVVQVEQKDIQDLKEILDHKDKPVVADKRVKLEHRDQLDLKV
tara:strand:+ start:395 stop:553 length:159 start_codon:yes stop_codon:yes gene_type:complete